MEADHSQCNNGNDDFYRRACARTMRRRPGNRNKRRDGSF
jgi:hypothetical protein